jgi:cell division protein FtsQ
MKSNIFHKLVYKLNRIFLRRLWRLVIVACLSLCVTTLFFYSAIKSGRYQSSILVFTSAIENGKNLPEFEITGIKITNIKDLALKASISRILPAVPVSRFDININNIKKLIVELPAVISADIKYEKKNLVVDLLIDEPVAIWKKNEEDMFLLKENGQIYSKVDNNNTNPGLLRISGSGADNYLTEAISIYNMLSNNKIDIRGMERLGQRRWDIILDSSIRLKLPAENPNERVADFIKNYAEYVSETISVIDLRTRDVVFLRTRQKMESET